MEYAYYVCTCKIYGLVYYSYIIPKRQKIFWVDKFTFNGKAMVLKHTEIGR